MKKIDKLDKAIKILKEMRLNYKFQYPEKIPDMNLVGDIIFDTIYLNIIRCDFCGEECDGTIILRDTNIQKVDGSDLILCGTCLNLYGNQMYEELTKRIENKNGRTTSHFHK